MRSDLTPRGYAPSHGRTAWLHDLAGVIHCPLDLLRRHRHGAGDRRGGAARTTSTTCCSPTTTRSRRRDHGEEGWHGSRARCWSASEVSPRRQNHYLAFGLDEPIDHRGLTPAQIVDARRTRRAASASSPHPFSQGSERFKRGGPGNAVARPRRRGLHGHRAVELRDRHAPSASTASATCCASSPRPQRFLDHPPQRNLDEWDRLCARRRCVALGGVDAHQVGIRVAGRVPLRLMAYKRSFRLPAHAPAGRPSRCTRDAGRRPRRACSARCARARATSRWTRSRPARGFRFWAEGDGALEMGDEAPAGRLDAARASCPRRARCGCCATAREVAAAHGDSARAPRRGPGRLPGRGLPRRPRARAHLDPLEPDLPALSRRWSAQAGLLRARVLQLLDVLRAPRAPRWSRRRPRW